MYGCLCRNIKLYKIFVDAPQKVDSFTMLLHPMLTFYKAINYTF